MLPDGWLYKKLGDLTIKVGSGITPKGGSSVYMQEGIPLIRSQNVLWGDLDLSDVVFISHKQHEKMKLSALKQYDVLLNITGASIGRVAVVENIVDANVNQHVCIIRRNNRVNHSFLKFFLLSYFGQKQIAQFQAGGNRQGLNFEQIRSFKILLPPLPEQTKIVQILSTWDKAIATVEQLIENSQQQKKALMQQLLMGKKRIGAKVTELYQRDGFTKKKLGALPKDWNVVLISNFFWYQEGPGVRKYQFTEAGIKLFNGTNIQYSRIDLSNTNTHISENQGYGAYKHFLADDGDLVIACSGISVDRFDEKIAFIKKEHLPLCMNTSTMRFKVRNKDSVCLNYLRYFMMSPLFKNQIRRQITGSAQLNFGPSHVGKCFIALPSIDEQKNISNILSKKDQEIDLLKKKFDLLKQEKKSLMQQLLTGKRRVTVDTAETSV